MRSQDREVPTGPSFSSLDCWILFRYLHIYIENKEKEILYLIILISKNFCFLRNLLIWQLFILLYYIIAFYMDIIHNSFILFKEIMPGYFPLSNGFKQHFIQQFIKGIIIISNMCQHHFLLYLEFYLCVTVSSSWTCNSSISRLQPVTHRSNKNYLGSYLCFYILIIG